MVALGYILLVLGLMIWLYGQARFLVVAYNKSLWWFFGCLFLPLVDWLFLFLNFRATVKPFGLILLGLIVAGTGGSMAGVLPVFLKIVF
jgi:FtsH-binding integral membrane protein